MEDVDVVDEIECAKNLVFVEYGSDERKMHNLRIKSEIDHMHGLAR